MGFECRCSVARELRPFAAWSAIAPRALGPLLRRLTRGVVPRPETKPLTLITRSESEPRPITADVPRGTMRPGDREVAAGLRWFAGRVHRRWGRSLHPAGSTCTSHRPTGASGRTVTGALCTPRILDPSLRASRTGHPLRTAKPGRPIAHKCGWSMFHVEHLARGPSD